MKFLIDSFGIGMCVRRLEVDVDLEVSYEPHFNTITKTGEANFSKIPHAVAELIDNSIQVCYNAPIADECISCIKQTYSRVFY